MIGIMYPIHSSLSSLYIEKYIFIRAQFFLTLYIIDYVSNSIPNAFNVSLVYIRANCQYLYEKKKKKYKKNKTLFLD